MNGAFSKDTCAHFQLPCVPIGSRELGSVARVSRAHTGKPREDAFDKEENACGSGSG